MRLYLQFVFVLGCCALCPSATRAQACESDTECEPEPIACDTNADCPLGLECETTRTVESCQTAAPGDDPPASDGGCTIEDVPVEAPSCVYAPVLCTQDAECDAGLSCQALGSVEECNSAPVVNCLPGETCEQTPEPICTRQQQSLCFPMRHDCADSSECDDGWRCTMLPEHALDDGPPGWEGATKICVPEGIALVLEGRVEVATTSDSVAEGRASGAGDGSNMDGDESESASEPMGDSAGACSVSAALPSSRSMRHGGVQALLLLALGLLGTRSLAKRRS